MPVQVSAAAGAVCQWCHAAAALLPPAIAPSPRPASAQPSKSVVVSKPRVSVATICELASLKMPPTALKQLVAVMAELIHPIGKPRTWAALLVVLRAAPSRLAADINSFNIQLATESAIRKLHSYVARHKPSTFLSNNMSEAAAHLHSWCQHIAESRTPEKFWAADTLSVWRPKSAQPPKLASSPLDGVFRVRRAGPDSLRASSHGRVQGAGVAFGRPAKRPSRPASALQPERPLVAEFYRSEGDEELALLLERKAEAERNRKQLAADRVCLG